MIKCYLNFLLTLSILLGNSAFCGEVYSDAKSGSDSFYRDPERGVVVQVMDFTSDDSGVGGAISVGRPSGDPKVERELREQIQSHIGRMGKDGDSGGRQSEERINGKIKEMAQGPLGKLAKVEGDDKNGKLLVYIPNSSVRDAVKKSAKKLGVSAKRFNPYFAEILKKFAKLETENTQSKVRVSEEERKEREKEIELTKKEIEALLESLKNHLTEIDVSDAQSTQDEKGVLISIEAAVLTVGDDSLLHDTIREAAIGVVEVARLAITSGDKATYVAGVEISQDLLDLLAGTDPVTGTLRDSFELVLGKNAITGEDLSAFERSLSGASLAATFLSLGTFSTAKAAVKGITGYARKAFKQINYTEFTSSLFRNTREITQFAAKYGISTEAGTKAYGRIHRSINNLPNGSQVQRIREGLDNGKVAVIGRSMQDAVNPVVESLRRTGHYVETFVPSDMANEKFNLRRLDYSDGVLPPSVYKETDLFSENQRWANRVKEEGHTVLDMGDPTNQDKVRESVAYQMERMVIFGDEK